MSDALITLTALLVIVFIAVAIIEPIIIYIEGSGMLFKKCSQCKKIKFRSFIKEKVYEFYGYNYKCNKCHNKEKLVEENKQRKREEYKRENELIRQHLMTMEERLYDSLNDRW